MSFRPRWFVLLACLAAVGCPGSDPFAPIESRDIRLTVRGITAPDITSGMIAKSASANTEPGDPWGDFLAEARSTCGGDPENFDVTLAGFGLDINTGTIESLDEVFTDSAAIYLRPGSTTADQVHIAEGFVLGSGGEFVFNVPGDLLARLRPLRAHLLAGDFHVAVSGATSRTSNESFSFDARVRLRALAYCGESP